MPLIFLTVNREAGLNLITPIIEPLGLSHPLFYVALFVAASVLMIWRLEVLTARGIEGTVVGTLVMPYCSGMANLIFVFVMAGRGGPSEEVMVNTLVNNVTNLTLLLGLPAIFWGMTIIPRLNGKKNNGKKKRKKQKSDHTPQINRLSLLLTLAAVLFFTGATWALARDGELNFGDGLVLVGLFVFWQCFHVFEVLKSNVQQNRRFQPGILLDFGLLALGAYGLYVSIDWLVVWISGIKTGFISVEYLGWLSGWLMVLPNAMLALYYAWRQQPEVVYSSQVGDGHICIPLCLGIFALYRPLQVPEFFETGVLLLLGAAGVHFFFVALFGRLPRWMGVLLVAAYGVFVYIGLLE